ncbi:MAG: ArsA family ATPase [Acidimicrobiia bacterium]
MSRTRTVIVTGAGGVGKTTVSAALAVVAAREGRRVLVVTVDPARRLADALGVPEVSNHPTAVPGLADLSAAMLDVTASWEAITHRHADPDVAERLGVNPFFRAIADRFPAAQAYAAGEQMAEFAETGYWDLVIVDTPPSVGGIDFFLAPSSMRELIGGRLLRWLTGARLPARRTLYRVTARPVLRIADNILGGPLLEDIAEFLLDLRTLHDGLRARARDIERLHSAAAVLVVTTAEPTPLRETRRFFERLPGVDITPRGVLFNRTLPDGWMREAGSPAGAVDPALRENLARWATESRKMQDARDELAARYRTPIATLPWLETAPTSIAGLAALMEQAEGLDWQRLAIPT